MRRTEIMTRIKTIEMDLAKIKAELINYENPVRSVPIDTLINEACLALGYPLKVVKSKLRLRDIVNVRYTIFWVLFQNGYSYTLIGQLFGFNHATVMHGVKTIIEGIHTKDKSIKMLIRKVSSLVDLNND